MSSIEIATPRVFIPLLENKRFKGIKGGRGSGKSHFTAELLVEEAILGHQRIVCAREVQNSIKDSVKQLIEDKIRKLGVEHLFVSTEKEIRGPNDSLFIFRGLQNHTSTSIKSLEGFTRLWCEEAQTISQKSIDLAIPTFRKKGSQCLFTWNPEKESDPVEKFFTNNEGDDDFICVTANYCDNPYFPEELRRDMERDKLRDPDKYYHVWMGGYQKNSEARVFNNWTIKEFEAPLGMMFRLGADWGFAKDPTVLVRCFAVNNKLFIDYETYMVECEINNTPDLFRRVPESDKWFITADSARPETISYMRKNGFPKINPAEKGKGSVEDGIEFLKSFDIVVHPRCVETIKELTLYSYKTDPLTGTVMPIFEDKNNHVIDALRYACEGIRKANKTKSVKPIVQPYRQYDRGIM